MDDIFFTFNNLKHNYITTYNFTFIQPPYNDNSERSSCTKIYLKQDGAVKWGKWLQLNESPKHNLGRMENPRGTSSSAWVENGWECCCEYIYAL